MFMETTITITAIVCFVSGGAIGFVSAIALTIGRAADSNYENGPERDSKEL